MPAGVSLNHFAEILTHLEEVTPKEVVVACDIDNTLLQSAQQLGSVAWGDHVIRELKSKGITQRQAQEIEDVLWSAVQSQVKVQTVDPSTPEIVQEIQNRGIYIVGLTSRSPRDFESTRVQLQSLGIDLMSKDPNISSRQEFLLEALALYDRGILFSSPFNKKSIVLKAFLEKNNIKPKLVIFIDDKPNVVADVEQAFTSQGLKCIGIRFGGADERVKRFNADIADVQWKTFPKLINDSEAKLQLAKKSP